MRNNSYLKLTPKMQKRNDIDCAVIFEIGREYLDAFISIQSKQDKRNLSKKNSLWIKCVGICNEKFLKREFLNYLAESISDVDITHFTKFKQIIESNHDDVVKICAILYHFNLDTEFRQMYESDPVFIQLIEKYITNYNFQLNEIFDNNNYTRSDEVMNDKRTYVGKIEYMNGYYNFVAEYCYKDNQIFKNYISEEEFPINGKLNIAKMSNSDIEDFKNENYKDNFIACSFDFDKIEENTQSPQTTRKIGIEHTTITKANSLGIHRVVNVRKDDSIKANDKQIIIESRNYLFEERVIVRYDNGENIVYMKPQTALYREADGVFYVMTDVKVTRIVQGYTKECIEKAKVFNDSEIYIDINKLTDEDLITFDSTTPKEVLSIITDEIAKNHLKDGQVSVARLNEIIASLDSNELFGPSCVDSELLDQRKEIVMNYLEGLKTEGDFITEVSDFICEVLLENKAHGYGNDSIKALIEEISKNTDILRALQGNNFENSEIEKLNHQLIITQNQNQKLKRDLEALDTVSVKKNIEDLKKQSDFELEIIQKEVLNLEEKKSEINTKLETLTDEYRQYADLKEVNEATKNAQIEYDEFLENKKTLENDIDQVIKHKFIENRSKNITDPKYIDNALNEYKECFDVISQIKVNRLKIDFKSHIVCEIKKLRDYTEDDIINIFASIYTGFITIFSGKPGTGKTSICNIISKVLGMDNFGTHNNVNLNRFVPISVERGWTSKKDLLGYYNPLTKAFDKSNKHLFDALSIQNQEVKEGVNRFPVFVLLDEANLSPMEYYWGDFMKIADFDNDVSSDLNLGNDLVLKVSKKLRFLATINNDHTTEDISPRLIDRSWIIELPENDSDISTLERTEYTKVDNSIISWDIIENYFEKVKVTSVDSDVADILNKIYNLCNKNDVPLSRRSKGMIIDYIKVTENIYKSAFKSLDYVIAQKILPTINGSGESYCTFLETFYELCFQYSLKKSTSMLSQIIENGKDNMYYFYYFR